MGNMVEELCNVETVQSLDNDWRVNSTRSNYNKPYFEELFPV